MHTHSPMTVTMDVGELSARVMQQGEKVRTLKKGNAAKVEIDSEVEILKQLKVELAAAEKAAGLNDQPPKFDRERLEDLAKRRFFYTPAFSIYGGAAGLFDLGPPGCALKANMESIWRQHFVLQENMLEVSCTNLTPDFVLKASGHVDKFADLMVRSTVNPDECYRADKLLEERCEARMADKKNPPSAEEKDKLTQYMVKADTFTPDEMDAILAELGVKDELKLGMPYEFNLMFETSIGPQGNLKGYLRPETAQGMFMNFRRLLEQNGGKMPFAAAQLGLGFRNEIAPRGGLLRVREFPMAEIEHFVHPEMKDHPKFDSIKDVCVPLFSARSQLGDGKVTTHVTLGQAVEEGMISSQTMAYFLARTFQYLVRVGVRPDCIRFRQHLPTQLAHYATDCWDAEAENSYGWTEIVGIADRFSDLSVHSKASKVPLVAKRQFEEPKDVEVCVMKPNKGKLGPAFKKEQNVVVEALEEKTKEEKMAIEKALADEGSYVLKLCTGQEFTILREHVSFSLQKKRVQEVEYTPSVIEPAFGVGRILYTILEHCFRTRDMEGQELRNYLSLPPEVAPTKVSILPISSNPEAFQKHLDLLREGFAQRAVSFKVDDSGQSVGKRYARTDEIGVPYGVTVDFQSLKDDTVTLRERDSMRQVRMGVEEVMEEVNKLVTGRAKWEEIVKKYPEFTQQEV